MERNENSRKGVKAILKLGKDSRVEIGGDQVRIFGGGYGQRICARNQILG